MWSQCRFSFAREGYSKTAFDAKDSTSALGFGGTWRLFAKHWRYGLGEYERAFSKLKFLIALQKMMPGLQMEDIVPGRAGISGQALDQAGKLVDDFVIERGKRRCMLSTLLLPRRRQVWPLVKRSFAAVKLRIRVRARDSLCQYGTRHPHGAPTEYVVPDDETIHWAEDLHGIRIVWIANAAYQFAFANSLTAGALKRKRPEASARTQLFPAMWRGSLGLAFSRL